MDPVQMTRRSMLCSIPLKLMRTSDKKQRIQIANDSSVVLPDHSAFEVSVVNEKKNFRSLTRFENHGQMICTKNLVEWYDPISNENLRKVNLIDYIIDFEEM